MKINTGCWVDGCKCFDSNDEDGVDVKRDRQWVGLTDEEILFVRNRGTWTHDIVWSYERAIEAKLKEKNGY